MIYRTWACWKKALLTIPQLSPTHTKARILQWYIQEPLNGTHLEAYDPLFLLECSPDLVTIGYRLSDTHHPKMIVEVHEEGKLQVHQDILTNGSDSWYPVGYPLGVIDDGEDDGLESTWLWQAYLHDDNHSK